MEFVAVIRTVSLALALTAALAPAAHAEPRGEPTAPPQCARVPALLSASLARTAARLARGERVTIVALGSSSTYGLGASTPAGAYPARVEAMLRERFPGADLRVLNRGINGEDTGDMIARMHRDVAAHKPDLVLWQVGTNDVLGNAPVSAAAPLIRKGLARLKATGAEVVLMDPQYAPAVLIKPAAERMVSFIATTAREHGVGVLRRFELMRDWHESAQIRFGAFMTADGLHMNDWGYDCIARQIAGAIFEAATPAVALTTTGREQTARTE